MNKATLIANINGFVTAIITQLKLRNAYLELINIFFSTIVTNTKTTTSLTPLSISETTNTWLNYNINAKREGNKTFLTGFIENKDTLTHNSFVALSFTDSQYNAKTGLDTILILKANDGTTLECSMALQNLFVTGIMAINKKYYINGFYYNND
jgi:hypothetical protein